MITFYHVKSFYKRPPTQQENNIIIRRKYRSDLISRQVRGGCCCTFILINSTGFIDCVKAFSGGPHTSFVFYTKHEHESTYTCAVSKVCLPELSSFIGEICLFTRHQPPPYCCADDFRRYRKCLKRFRCSRQAETNGLLLISLSPKFTQPKSLTKSSRRRVGI